MATMNNPTPPSVSPQKFFYLYLTGLALAGVGLGFAATAHYGPGLASDSVIYLAVAQSLLDGQGLTTYMGVPLLAWPPLLSIVIAGLGLVTRLDVYIVGWALNLVLLGVNIFLSGVIFWRIFHARPVYAWLASAFVALSISLLRIHATTFSEPLYLTMTLGLYLALAAYSNDRSRRAFLWMVLLSALAPLLRYVGMAFAVVSLLTIMFENRRTLPVLLKDGFVLGVVAALPIGWWLIWRNLLTYGNLFGTGEQTVDVLQNTSLGLTKIMHWFVPYLDPLMPILTRPFVVLATLVVLIGLVNRKRTEFLRAWWQRMSASEVYPVLVYGVVYFLAVVMTSITADHRWLNDDDRYYVILLVPVLVVVFSAYDQLLLPHLGLATKKTDAALVVIFLIWSLYPVYGLREYLVRASQNGEPSSYNSFNTRALQESPVVAAVQQLRSNEPNALVYSNYTDAAWLFTRKPVQLLPDRARPNYEVEYNGWPYDQPGYIVWFKPNEYKAYLSPEELSRFAVLELIYTDESGDIYTVKAR